jgi:hypothetical protein
LEIPAIFELQNACEGFIDPKTDKNQMNTHWTLRLIVLLLLVAGFSLQSPAQCEKKAEKFRKALNKQFRGAKHSPLTEEDRADFDHLEFYAYNPELCVVAKWVPTPNEEAFEMPTSNVERSKSYAKYGELHFEIRGREMKINVYQRQKDDIPRKYKNHLFIPFTDLTSGFDSYGGGRYMDWILPKEGKPIILDFNQCYNPYCAYSTGWSCPIPPDENFLDIKINGGVKDWEH